MGIIIFRILQHFGTKFCNCTNFTKPFLILIINLVLAYINVVYNRKLLFGWERDQDCNQSSPGDLKEKRHVMIKFVKTMERTLALFVNLASKMAPNCYIVQELKN